MLDEPVTRPCVVVRIEMPAGQPKGEGWALGVQIYDPVSGRFLEEGRWLPMPEPGLTTAEIEVPAETGAYRLYVSPVHTESGWAYAQGGVFWVIDVRVEEDGAHVETVRRTTRGALRRSEAWGKLREAIQAAVTVPWRHQAMIRSMVRRDILARYRGSFGDAFWTWLNPLLLMAAYLFVFGFVLQAKFPGDPSRLGFGLYFLAGMIPWLCFAEALARSPQLVIEYRNFVKKILFPIETLPLTVTLAAAVTSGFAGAIYLAGLLALDRLHWTLIWLPLVIVPQLLLTFGLCWLLAAIGAFVRDLAQMMTFLLTLWFFLTPICYPESLLPVWAWTFLKWNPMLHVARAWRAVLLEGRAPEPGALIKLWLIGVFASFAGFVIFYRLKKSFSDVL